MDDATLWQRLGIVVLIAGPLVLAVCLALELVLPWIDRDPRPENRRPL